MEDPSGENRSAEGRICEPGVMAYWRDRHAFGSSQHAHTPGAPYAGGPLLLSSLTS